MRIKLTKQAIDRIVRINLAPASLSPTFAGLIIIGHCNNKCRTCTYWQRKFEELSTQQWKKIIDKLFSAGVRDFGLIGGEPLLRSDFFELAKCIKSYRGTVSITTNGVIAEKFAKELMLFDIVAFSINSLNHKIHDEIVGVKGAHEKTISSFRKLRAIHPKVGINFVIQDKNYEEILNMVRFAEQEKASFLDLIYVSLNAFDKTVCDNAQLRNFDEEKLMRLLKEACKHKIVVEGFDYFRLAIARNKKRVAKPCFAPFMGILVNTNGDVLPCCGPIKRVGNILYSDWNKIWKNYSSLRKAALCGTLQACQRCTATAIESHYTVPYIFSKLFRK